VGSPWLPHRQRDGYGADRRRIGLLILRVELEGGHVLACFGSELGLDQLHVLHERRLLEETDEARQRLRQIVKRELDPAFPESREGRLQTLVERWRKLFGEDQNFARPILERANILASTCLIAGGYYLRDQVFDWAIVDEAGRATTPELLVALVRTRRMIIVGDERQLPPMLDEELNDNALARLGTSREQLSERLFASLATPGKDEQLPAVQMLTTQHRMHPSIGNLISAVFYDGMLTATKNIDIYTPL